MIIWALKKNSFFYSYLNNFITFQTFKKNENVQPWKEVSSMSFKYFFSHPTRHPEDDICSLSGNKKKVQSLRSVSLLMFRRELHLHLLSVGSDWTRTIFKVSPCHQDSYWLCAKPPYIPVAWSTCLNYKVSMYLNCGKQKIQK